MSELEHLHCATCDNREADGWVTDGYCLECHAVMLRDPNPYNDVWYWRGIRIERTYPTAGPTRYYIPEYDDEYSGAYHTTLEEALEEIESRHRRAEGKRR